MLDSTLLNDTAFFASATFVLCIFDVSFTPEVCLSSVFSELNFAPSDLSFFVNKGAESIGPLGEDGRVTSEVLAFTAEFSVLLVGALGKTDPLQLGLERVVSRVPLVSLSILS